MTETTDLTHWRDTKKGAIAEVLLRSKGCLSLYNNLNKGMGSFFFFFMSFNQIAIIFYLFMTITTLLDGKYDISSLCFGMSFGLGTLGLAISVVSVTLALDRLVFEKYVDEIIEGGGIFIKKALECHIFLPNLLSFFFCCCPQMLPKLREIGE